MNIARIPSMLYGIILTMITRIFGAQTVTRTKRVLVLSMWMLVLIATFSTVALWTSLHTTYGGTDKSTKERRGLVEGFRKLQHSVDDLLNADPQRLHVYHRGARDLPSTVCPEIDIPGEETNMTINTNETSMSDAEEFLFQTSTLKVRQLTRTADSLVKKLYATPTGMYKPSIEETLADALVVNNYIYIPGGHWIPAQCLPRWKVAIIIPFRDRFYHLPILLKHLVPFLQSQYLEFGIFVAEQANELQFNRAMLMNVGFVEALNYSHWDCFIFHDVDHIPLNYANYYGCSHMPRHFLSGADRWGYKLLYGGFFGAVTGFTRTQIEKFNGFPNAYWGWGGEDDDILGRIRKLGFFKTRPWGVMGFYNVIHQHHESAKKNTARVCLLKHYYERVYTDGLNNLVYSKPEVMLFPLYTIISADIQHLEWNPSWTECPERKPEDQVQKPKPEEQKPAEGGKDALPPADPKKARKESGKEEKKHR